MSPINGVRPNIKGPPSVPIGRRKSTGGGCGGCGWLLLLILVLVAIVAVATQDGTP